MTEERKLPNPATTNDEFAYATVLELRRLNANMERLVTIIDEVTKTPEVIDEEPGQDIALVELEKKPSRPKVKSTNPPGE